MPSYKTLQILNDLPEVFTVNEFCLYYGKKQYKTMLSCLNKKGIIKKAGVKSNIYYNMIKIKEVTTEHIKKALKKLYPFGLFSGLYILYKNGFTSQIPYTLSYILPSATKPYIYRKINSADILYRPKKYFFYLKSKSIDDEIKPSYVIADMVIFSDYGYNLTYTDIDMLDTDELNELIRELHQIEKNMKKEFKNNKKIMNNIDKLVKIIDELEEENNDSYTINIDI
ncbi:hypothetical protein DEFDS_P130 (plasmid) [Deferribacter desulfuricans SSM1]|uniref:AbiEi antitoxin C-terminal domain-containing protein n=1 Tax=Deferribacter desulfuricans (strain DSM 14783 / JCM 11476 / NBRC 101012 / SSM1) TaxID=639282 RepID=D3PEW0_DEFDS|nr:hypothetical protein [Deferribacter desulfuricans]BAI81752.1 hypothetical protein DEFDS_P130 [Deferribacter desulfuricans SSM1]